MDNYFQLLLYLKEVSVKLSWSHFLFANVDYSALMVTAVVYGQTIPKFTIFCYIGASGVSFYPFKKLS